MPPLHETSSLAAAFVTLLAITRAGPLQEEREPPPLDILILSVEDMRPFLGCYGLDAVSTPNIDALAARGVRFERAYCQVPLCNPSRASVSTGLRPETSGVFDNQTDWLARLPEGHATLEERFQGLGYRTVRCSKIHHKIDRQHVSSASRQRESSLWTEVLAPTPQRGSRSRGTSPAGKPPKGLKKDDYNRRTLRWGSSQLPAAEQMDGMNARAVAAFLEQPRDEPLYLALGLKSPHYPLFSPEEFVARHDAGDVELAPLSADDLDDVPFDYGLFNRSDGLWLSEDERRQVLASYYACISYVDDCIGVVLDALERSGRLDRTLICLWSDHGMHFGEHSLYRKYTLFEETARVPLILAGPGIAEGAVWEAPVELVDLYPTLLELVGASVPAGLEGSSLVSILSDTERAADEQAVAFTSRQPGQRSLRTARYRYTEWESAERAELYDHRRDPGEVENLAGRPEYAEIQAELRRRLAAGAR